MDQLATLSEEARELALGRFRMLQPHLENGVSLRLVAEEAGIPFRTAQRWVGLYREFGLAGFSRKNRGDKGEPRAVSALVREAIEGLALQSPPLPISVICRQIRRLAEETGEDPPSYWVIHRIVTSLPSALTTLAHEGSKAYGETFELIHRREAEGPNAVWQADHTPLDILVLRPDGQAVNPWLTVVIDDFSRAVMGYFLSFEAPCSLHTSLALRQAIWRKGDSRWGVCGIPDVLYTDNGSDFTSRHLEQVGADLKIRLVFSIPDRPRGRGKIERFFSTVNEMFLCELEGYSPAGGKVRGKPRLTLAELDARFRTFLLDVYHRQENSETKVRPLDRWEAGGFLPRMPDSLEQLDLLLIRVAKSRQVRADGIYFQSLRYISTTLAAYVGETVTLRYDPRDMGEVRVFHEEKFLCRAVCAELAGETVPLREIITARNRRRRELRGVLKDRQKTVDTLLELKCGEVKEKPDESPSPRAKQPTKRITSALKRYRNE